MLFSKSGTARVTSDNLDRYIDLVDRWDLPSRVYY